MNKLYKLSLPHLIEVAACLWLLFSCLTAAAQSQGPNNPGNVTISQFACLSCPGEDWVNFNNVKTANDTFGTVNLTAGGYCFQSECYKSRGLEPSNYGFSIPLSANITGIEVSILRKAYVANGVKDSLVLLMRDVTPTACINHATAAYWGTTNQAVTYGGPTDLWGLSWTAAQIDSTGFGVYLLVANYNAGADTAAVDNINVTVYYSNAQPLPVAAFSANDTVICAGDSVMFTDQSTGDVSSRIWAFPGGTPLTGTLPTQTVVYPVAGQYSVTLVVTDSTGSDTLTKMHYITVDSLPATPVITAMGDTLNSSSATGNQWYLNGNIIAGATGSQYIATDTGNYTDVVTNSNNCSATSAQQQVLPTGISSLSASTTLFELMPNPSNGSFFVHVVASKAAPLAVARVLDIAGKVIMPIDLNIQAGDNRYFFNLDGKIQAGIYFVELAAGDWHLVQKLVVE